MWIDLGLFVCLFALFIYVFVSVTITSLHKVYLMFHFFVMLWPFCQFAIQLTENPQVQLYYVSLAFVGMSLMGVGWLVFSIYLADELNLFRKKISYLLFVPALIATLCVIVNPNGAFVLPVGGGYVQRTYGILFWFMLAVLLGYFFVSMYLMYRTIVSDKAIRIKRQVKLAFFGFLLLTAFALTDTLINVALAPWLPIIPGLTSMGILLADICFVIAIKRHKVFDVMTIAHQDVIDTMSYGIVVLDENEKVIEINKVLEPYINLSIGDRFDMEEILCKAPQGSEMERFIQSYRKDPPERAQIQMTLQEMNIRHVAIRTAPIMAREMMIGRIIMFEDVSQMRQLMDETNAQNEALQERNLTLIKIQDELFQANQKLELIAITDSLTGCYNRRYLTQQLELEILKNLRYRIPFAIVLFDIDFFKEVNDRYGHLVGDEVLCNTVDIVKRTLRQTDILARYGGEEFMIYLPHTSKEQVVMLADRVKDAVESNKVVSQIGQHTVSITISMGVLSIREDADEFSKYPNLDLNHLLATVDEALLQAKKEGRNRIIITDLEEGSSSSQLGAR